MIHIHTHPQVKGYLRIVGEDGRDLGNIYPGAHAAEFYPSRDRVSFSLPDLQSIVDVMKEREA